MPHSAGDLMTALLLAVMHKWRPKQSISTKALGLHWRGNRLLATEILDDCGNIKGVRPLGGSVEFGETWQQALIREFTEELGITVEITGPPQVMENIFEHHGAMGHEIIFVAEVCFPDAAFADQDCIKFTEDNGAKCTARWFDLDDLDGAGHALFPTGLKDISLKTRP